MPSLHYAGTNIGIWLATAAMLIFSVCSLSISVASRKLDTDAGALLGAAVTVPLGVLVAAGQFLAGRELTAPSAYGIGAFIVAGILSTYLGRWLLFKSIETIGPTRSAAFMTCSPLVTAFIGWAWLGQHLDKVSLAGMVIAVSGLLIMSQGRAVATGAASRGARAIAGSSLAIGMGSTVAYAVSHVFRGAAVREWNEPVVGATLGAAAGLAVLVFVSRRRLAVNRARIAEQRGSAWLYCAVGAMQLAAQVLMIASMAHIPVAITTLIATCTPLVVMPISVIFMRNVEQIRPATVAGVIATVSGVLLAAVFSGAR